MYTSLIAFAVLSVALSFLCSIWEAVLLSVTPAWVESRVREGSSVGTALQRFGEDIDRPLLAILTLNTIAHTAGAIGVGVQASAIWDVSLVATLALSVAMTLAMLLLSKIVPKTIGANHWRALLPFTVRSVQLLLRLLAPLVFVGQLVTWALRRDKAASAMSRADLSAMADLGTREGVLDEGESTIVRNLLRMGTVLAEHVMTPRTVMTAADETMTVRAFDDAHSGLRFSRVPVYEGTPDGMTGYVLKDAVLRALVDGHDDTPLSALRRDITAVRGDTPLHRLLDHFTTGRESVALVLDDFGGTAGLVTMEDVIETLIGTEIVDERDGVDDMQAMARGKWEERARRVGLLAELDAEGCDPRPDAS